MSLPLPKYDKTRHAQAPPITMETPQPLAIPFGSDGYIGFDQRPPKWSMPLINKIAELGDLRPNWNSYGATPIDPETAVSAIALILNVMSAGDPQPAVVPTSRGGVLLEWHEGGIDLEVDVRSPSSVNVTFEDGEIEEEFEVAEVELIQRKLGILRDRL